MVYYMKLAITIAIAFQPICATERTEHAGFTRDWFEELVRMIPNDNVRNRMMNLYENKNYVDLEDNLLEYLDEYMESSLVGQERVDIERKKADIMSEVIGFIENEAKTGGSKDIDSFENKDNGESNEEKAIIKFHEIIDAHVFPDKREGAEQLLKDKHYGKLEEFILYNIKYENENADALNKLSGAMDLTTHSSKKDLSSFEDAEVMEGTNAIAILQNIIDNHLPHEKNLEATSLLKEKNYNDLEKYILENVDLDVMFGDGTDQDGNAEVFHMLSSTMKALHGSVAPASKSAMLQPYDSSEASLLQESDRRTTAITPEQVANATKKMDKLIEEDVIQDKKAKAKSLLEKKDYDALEDFVLDNLDQSELTDFGDEQGTNILNTLSSAMDVLHASAAPASNSTVSKPVLNTTILQEIDLFQGEESVVMDSLANEEEMLSTLRGSISKTEEEIEELISRLNENE